MSDAIVFKIRKLLLVADGNANMNESDNALRMAKKLADAHNLNLNTIRGSFGAPSLSRPIGPPKTPKAEPVVGSWRWPPKP